MRILAVTNLYPTERHPGLGTFIQQQVESLRCVGVEVDVLFFDRAAEGVNVYRSVASATRQQVAKVRPDVVHVMYGGVLACLATRPFSAGPPTVVSFCGPDLLGEPAKTVVRRLAIAGGVAASRWAARRVEAVIVKSANLRMALPAGVSADRVWTIPNGVNLQQFRPMDPEKCRLRLGWRSGVRHVLFPSFPERANKRFSLARKAVDLLATRGFEVELHTLHDVPHDDVPVWLNASDCLLLTSTQEGSPNIVKEALACDRPVVSVDVGDVAERTAGRQDCFVTAHRPEDLAAKLEIVLRNRAAFSGVRTLPGVSDLSLEAVAERLCQVYRIVIDRWVASHRRAAA